MAKGGRPGGGGMGAVTPAQQKTVNKISKQTRNLKKEQYRIIDAEGNVVAVSKGDNHSVGMTLGEKREKMPGSVSIHNHPDGGTFSGADFNDFGTGARAVYAAAPEGTYSLVNTKYGTREQYNGWVKLRDAYNSSVGSQSYSYLDLKDKATKTKRYQKLSKQASGIADKWVKAKNAGKPQSVLDELYKKHTAVTDKMKTVLKEEVRKAEVTPAHNWLKKNAGKYGFAYKLTKAGR